MVAVLYNSFNLNDNVNYFLTIKPLSSTKIDQTLSPMARLEGGKVSGQRTGPKTIPCTCTVVGNSRSDLESKLDALYQALTVPQQHLVLHSLDNRYFIATALYQEANLAVDTIIAVPVKITFICPSPYALAPSSSTYDTGIVTFGQVGSMWQSPNIMFPGGGTVYSRPTIVLTNQRLLTTSQLISVPLVNGTVYTSLAGIQALTEPLYVGDVLTLAKFETPPLSGMPTQQVIVSANANIGDTSISVDSFMANYSYPINSGGSNPTGTSITNDISWHDVIIQQTNDNQYFAVSSSNGFVPGHANTLTIIGDPTVAGGWTIIDSSQPGVLIEPIGTPPQLDTGNTSFVISIAANGPVLCEAVWSWTARYLS